MAYFEVSRNSGERGGSHVCPMVGLRVAVIFFAILLCFAVSPAEAGWFDSWGKRAGYGGGYIQPQPMGR